MVQIVLNEVEGTMGAALAAVRRGRAVALVEETGARHLVLPAELATSETFELLRRLGPDAVAPAEVSVREPARPRTMEPPRLERSPVVRLPNGHGPFAAVGFRDAVTGDEHLALVRGDVAEREGVLVRLQPGCLAGDALGSRRCGCRIRLAASLTAIAAAGAGVLVQLPRGTCPHDLPLGPAPDSARWGRAAGELLAALGVRSARLLTDAAPNEIALGGAVAVLAEAALAVAATPEDQEAVRAV